MWAQRQMVALSCLVALGCGTTRWSDTPRTATEQVLLSDAIDKAIGEIDFSVLAGKEVFFDDQYLDEVFDKHYLISSMRQHLLASGAIIKEKREDATYIVEARAGAVGTNRNDLLFGMPAVTLPMAVPGAPLPSSIPEIPLAKKTDQMGVAKIAVFAYNRETGRPAWQSGLAKARSSAKDSWFFGAGPFQKGSIYDGTQFAGENLEIPIISGSGQDDIDGRQAVPITAEMVFPEPIDANSPAMLTSGTRRPTAEEVLENGVHRLPPTGPYAPGSRQAQRTAPPATPEKSFFDFFPPWVGRGETPQPGDKSSGRN